MILNTEELRRKYFNCFTHKLIERFKKFVASKYEGLD